MPRILTIAGSDSGGGAGIQADLKTITVLGGFGMSAITALTAQNTQGVQNVWPMSPDQVREQFNAVVSDIGVDAIKTGMIANAPLVETVAELCADINDHKMVIDPVMVASSGYRLTDGKTTQALSALLLPLADIVTPNSHEAEILTGQSVENETGQNRAAHKLLELGAKAALVKGGHIDGPEISNILHTQKGEFTLKTPRIHSRNTHGTGCTMAAAIATLWVDEVPLEKAAQQAQEFVAKAIAHAPDFGKGHNGPMHHGFSFEQSQ